MNSLKILTALSLTVILFSCKKTISDSQAVVTKSSEQASVTGSDCERRWFGQYVNVDGVHFDTIPDRKLISNGVAHVPPVGGYYYFSNVLYIIPLCHEISGDSVRFEASVKNSGGTGGLYDYDVYLTMTGKKNWDRVHFVSSPGTVSYSSLSIGDQFVGNIPALVYNFSDFTSVALETKDLNLNVYKSDTILIGHTYKRRNAIGQLQQIFISFKGSGSVDWVKLYNSNTGKLLMEEQFSVDGESSVVWYD